MRGDILGMLMDIAFIVCSGLNGDSLLKCHPALWPRRQKAA